MGRLYGQRSRGGPPPPPDPLADVRNAALKAYDVRDGQGADWAGMADTLFRLAFEAVGHLEATDTQRQSILRRAETGVYERLHGQADEAR